MQQIAQEIQMMEKVKEKENNKPSQWITFKNHMNRPESDLSAKLYLYCLWYFSALASSSSSSFRIYSGSRSTSSSLLWLIYSHLGFQQGLREDVFPRPQHWAQPRPRVQSLVLHPTKLQVGPVPPSPWELIIKYFVLNVLQQTANLKVSTDKHALQL